MKRSISQRIYLWGLMPLALLAIALTIFNGMSRMKDVQNELLNAQTLTATLLHAPAVDALVVGNTLSFDELVKDVIAKTPLLVCISLRDLGGRVIAEGGRCSAAIDKADLFDVLSNNAGLSDFNAPPAAATRVGTLRLSMSKLDLVKRKRILALQLAINLALVLAIVALIVRVLRARLIKPIQQLDAAMNEVSQRNYSVRLESDADDEIGRLGVAMNRAMETIAAYMRELELRRSDADRALHEADEAALARDGLIRSLSDELEGPLSGMYTELTNLAIANKDTAIRERIKTSMAMLDEVQSTFNDLMEVAVSSRVAQHTSMQELADVSAELLRSMRTLSASEGKPLNLEDTTSSETSLGLYVSLDGIRLRKVVSYVMRAMYQHCSEIGIYAQFNTITLPDSRLHISMQLKAFFEPLTSPVKNALSSIAPNGKAVPGALRWTERDKKVIEHLLRAANVAVTYSALPSGMIFVQLETVVQYQAGALGNVNRMDWLKSPPPLVTTIISNDGDLLRLTTHGHLSRHEIKLLPYQAAVLGVADLRGEDVIIVDCGPDAGEVLSLIGSIKSHEGRQCPQLIALCPRGDMSDALMRRLKEWGFSEVLQKPVQLRGLFEVIQKVVSDARAHHDA